MAEPAGTGFRLIWSERNRQIIRRLGERAAAKGLLDEFAASLLDLDDKLTTDPLAWGDPQHVLKSTGLTVCHGMHEFVHILYGVQEQQRIVFVKKVFPLPGGDLED